MHQEAVALTRGQEAEAAQRDATPKPASCRGEGSSSNGAVIGIVFAIGGKRISPVNLLQIMHTLGGKARGHGGRGEIFVGGRRNRWEISKEVVAKSSKNVIQLNT
jgi:hypothetical protein